MISAWHLLILLDDVDHTFILDSHRLRLPEDGG
jgi:hypothetical protein